MMSRSRPRGAAAAFGTCPHCGKDAPLVYRGVAATCAACGRPRVPLTEKAVNLAGQPSKVGGEFARYLGWAVLVVGLTVAAVVAALFQALFPAGFLGWMLGLVLALAAAVVGTALVRGGKSLFASGVVAERATFLRAVFAMAQNRGGVLSALDVAQALAMSPARADALLTELAKEDPDRVRLEVDDAGALTYVFPECLPPTPPIRVSTPRLPSPARTRGPDVVENDAEAVADTSARRR